MKKIYPIFLLLALFTLASAPVSAVRWPYKVSIDPGHGGNDPGALGPSAPHEGELCLRASLQMRTQLQGVGAPVTMTRTTNATLSLTARRSHFLAQDPYVAVSVHLNAFNGSAHGTETWYYWSAGNSYPLAVKVQNRLVQQMGRANRGVKQNGWTVITASSNIPSVLTEGLFVDNYTEWNLINTNSKQGFKNWVNGHVLGFWDHLKTFNSALDNPTSTAPAKTPTISPSTGSLAFGNVVAGQTKNMTFTVSTKDLSGAISVKSNSGAFTVSPASLGTGGGTVTVTFKPTAAQSYSGTITLSSSGAASKTVSVSGAGQGRVVNVNTGSLDFGAVNKDATKNMTFTVSGSNLNNNISVSSNSGAFTVSPTSFGTGGGTVTVTFRPTAVQNYTGTITLSSSGASSATVSVKGSGKVPPLNLTEKFNISQTKNNTTTKGWDATKVRNFAYGSGKLYMVYEHNSIKVAKSQSGDFLYDLNKNGISGGALTLCDVAVFDGKTIACNLGTDTSPLKVYVWDNDFAEPRVLLQTTNLGGTTRLGDVIGFTGNLTNGKLTFANDDGTTTRIVNYAITNGTVSTTPTVINATTNGTTRLACAASIRVQPDANGYWINGKDNPLTRLDTSGKMSYEVPQDNHHGNGFSAFVYQGVQYAVMTTFSGSTNYVGGAMELVEASKGWQGAEVLGTYPSGAAGLGSTPNTNCTGGCYAHAGSNYVESWVLSTGQGIAYYATGTPPTHTYTTSELSTSLTSLAFGNVVQAQSKTMTFNVSAARIEGNISVSSNNAAYTVSPASLGSSGGTVTVTFRPTAKQAYPAKITVTGGGITRTVDVTGAGIEDPAVAKSILVSPGSLNLSCVYDQTTTGTLTITSTNLTSNITVSSSSANFTVSPTSLPSSGGKVTVTFKPSAQQTYNGTITFASAGASNVTVGVTGVGQALGDVFFTEKWNHSTQKNTVGAEGWDANNVRNMAYDGNGNLYVTYGANQIKVINSQTGKPIRDMNTDGVAGGWPAIGDVAVFDGKVVACNIPNVTAPDLKVYVWDSPTGAPRVALTTQNFGGVTARISDYMGFHGTWSNGQLSFGAASGHIVNYKITNGTIASSPTVVNVTNDGKPYTFASTVKVVPDATGYYINGKGGLLARLNTSGVVQHQLTQSNNHGAGFTVFSYYGSNYVLSNTFVSPTNYQGGAAEWYDVGSDWNAASLKATLPEAGLGTTANTNCTGDALVVTGNGYMEAWVLSTNQGIAYYNYGTVPNFSGTTPSNPTLNVSPASLAFGNVDVGQTSSRSFVVSASDLNEDIVLSSNSAAYDIEPASLPKTGGSITVTFAPTEAKLYSGAISISSGSLEKTVSLTGAGVASVPVVRTLEVSQTSLSLSCAVDKTHTASFTVTGENLTGNITVSSNLKQLEVSPKTLGAAGGVVTVTFNPEEVKTYNGTVTVSASGVTSKTVSVTGTATALGSITFTEGWNQSVRKANSTANSWDATKIRNMAYGNNGKLYYVHDHSEIKVLESQTGKYVGALDKTGISGGTLTLCDVAYFDGKVVACNLRVGNATPFIIYVWDGERSKPRKILETTNFGGLGRIGETIGFHGTWTDGKVSFGESAGGVTRIASYKITNGTIATTPTTIEVTADGAPLVYTSTVRVQPDATGYYINGKGGNLTRLNASGVKQYDINQTNRLANGGMPFSYYGNDYVVASTFLTGNYEDGAMQVFSVGNNWSNPSLVGTYPSAGLGTGNNTGGTGHSIAAVSESGIELWVLSTLQGIAYYKYGTPPNFGSISLETSEEMVSDNTHDNYMYVSDNTLYVRGIDAEKVELYSLSGVRILTANNTNKVSLPGVSSGVYIAVVTTPEGVIRRQKISVN